MSQLPARHAEVLAHRLLCLALRPLRRRMAGDYLLFAIDDTPTARYGPKVQGAGILHNPTPGPAGEKFVDHGDTRWLGGNSRAGAVRHCQSALERAGMPGARKGLILGRVRSDGARLGQAIQAS